MGLLSFDQVTFYYEKEKEIISNTNLTLDKGEFHCLLGRSGCGKTTLLKLAAGLLVPTCGQVLMNGKLVTKPSEDTGFVFQEPTLLRWKTVLQNVLLPVSLKKKVMIRDISKAHELLRLMGIEQYANNLPGQLSGGQQARVSIARALMMSPSLLFMDEPFAALDALTREELQRDLLHLCKKENMTVLFITHDISEAVYLADIITVMEAGKLMTSFEYPRPQKMDTTWKYSYQFAERCRSVLQELERKRVE